MKCHHNTRNYHHNIKLSVEDSYSFPRFCILAYLPYLHTIGYILFCLCVYVQLFGVLQLQLRYDYLLRCIIQFFLHFYNFQRIIQEDNNSLCFFTWWWRGNICLYYLDLTSHSKIFHSYRDVTITDKWPQILTYALCTIIYRP